MRFLLPIECRSHKPSVTELFELPENVTRIHRTNDFHSPYNRLTQVIVQNLHLREPEPKTT